MSQSSLRFDIPPPLQHTRVHALPVPIAIRRRLWEQGIETLRELHGMTTHELQQRCGFDAALLDQLVAVLVQPAGCSDTSADLVAASGVDGIRLSDLVVHRLPLQE